MGATVDECPVSMEDLWEQAAAMRAVVEASRVSPHGDPLGESNGFHVPRYTSSSAYMCVPTLLYAKPVYADFVPGVDAEGHVTVGLLYDAAADAAAADGPDAHDVSNEHGGTYLAQPDAWTVGQEGAVLDPLYKARTYIRPRGPSDYVGRKLQRVHCWSLDRDDFVLKRALGDLQTLLEHASASASSAVFEDQSKIENVFVNAWKALTAKKIRRVNARLYSFAVYQVLRTRGRTSILDDVASIVGVSKRYVQASIKQLKIVLDDVASLRSVMDVMR